MRPEIRFACPACRSSFSVPHEMGGQKVRCSNCSQKLAVPIPPEDVPIVTAINTRPERMAPAQHAPRGFNTPAPGADSSHLFASEPVPAFAPLTASGVPAVPQGLASPPTMDRPLSLRTMPGAIGELGSPVVLLVACLFFFLPWTEVQCNSKTWVTQSGFQACYGGVTETIVIPEDMRRQAKDAKAKDAKGAASNDDALPTAPLLVVYFLLLLVALMANLVLAVTERQNGTAIHRCIAAMNVEWLTIGAIRRVLVGSAGLLAFFLLLIQLVVGFPFDRQLAKAQQKVLTQRSFNDRDSDDLARAGALTALSTFQVRQTAWFWIALLMTLTVPLLIALEQMMLRGLRLQLTLNPREDAG